MTLMSQSLGMPSSLEELLGIAPDGEIKNPHPPNSRYQGVPLAVYEGPDGVAHVYLRRRFVAQPDQFELLEEHIVTDGERPDHVAHQRLGDPEQFWRLCDANAALDPWELVEIPGRRIRITMPEGIPRGTDA